MIEYFEIARNKNPIWFWPVLLGVVVFGVLVRVAFSISIWSRGLTADAHFFDMSSAFIASGKGYETLSGDQPRITRLLLVDTGLLRLPGPSLNR
jgi:hypothetical protein